MPQLLPVAGSCFIVLVSLPPPGPSPLRLYGGFGSLKGGLMERSGVLSEIMNRILHVR